MESLIGKIIDGYRILEVVGRGGMGVVYKALDTSLDKVVALKMIDPVLARDENFLKRFKTEARALARLENPNIVTVHALRDTEFGVFMVMEYVQAKTISDWIREKGPFDWKDSVEISKQLLNAVGHAHKVGVIHRDIKPSNILLCQDFRVKVTDFGLAKVIRQHGPSSTVTQMRAGTLYYMSPEQIKGLKNVDFRSDIYSLGMTIYEMLAGRVPFEKTESDFSIQKMIVEGQIPSPQKFNSDIPRSLVKIISKAIDKDPQKRYQSAEEMMEQIQKIEVSPVTEKKTTKAPRKIFSAKSAFMLLSLLIVVFLGFILIQDPFHFFDGDGKKEDKLVVTKMASLSLSSTPEGANIFINDSAVGITPMEDVEVREGRISLQIQKKGYRPVDTSLFVQTAALNEYQFNLKSETVQMAAVKVGTVIITSQPGEASVWIDNKFVGTTPREGEELRTGRHMLLLRKRGYSDYSSSFTVREGETTRISPVLEALASITVTSEPAGAMVLLNDNSIGTTPLSDRTVKAGTYRMTLRKAGYRDDTATITLSPDENSKFVGILEALKGELKILIRPWGSIYVDGELREKDTNEQYRASLAVGVYRVKAVHPALGEWQQDVKVEPDKIQDLVIDFNRENTLTVTSEPNYCQILLNGQPTGKYTPKQLKLRTGTHTISVQKDGYSLQGGPLQVSIYQDVKEPLHFKLAESQ
ncbi:MAG: serine/threonine protein kinase [Calditrichaeota bacterium]|nr:serine/threonine protein kinase [Calditrichota bacterium]